MKTNGNGKRHATQQSLNGAVKAICDVGFDLKAVNPNAKADEDTRTPEEILDLIEQKQKEIAAAICKLRAMR